MIPLIRVRFPYDSPYRFLSSAVERLVDIQEVTGSTPVGTTIALVVKWYNGSMVRSSRQFDSVLEHQIICRQEIAINILHNKDSNEININIQTGQANKNAHGVAKV